MQTFLRILVTVFLYVILVTVKKLASRLWPILFTLTHIFLYTLSTLFCQKIKISLKISLLYSYSPKNIPKNILVIYIYIYMHIFYIVQTSNVKIDFNMNNKLHTPHTQVFIHAILMSVSQPYGIKKLISSNSILKLNFNIQLYFLFVSFFSQFGLLLSYWSSFAVAYDQN